MKIKNPGRIVGVGHPNLILDTLRELSKANGYRLETNPRDISYHTEWNSVHCAMTFPGGPEGFAAQFDIQQMPGCCAVLILSYVKTYPYSKDNFNRILEVVELAAYNAGFGSVMMTQVVPAYSKMLWKDEQWIKCLDRKWKYGPVFRNAKSGNLVTYLQIDLGQKGKRNGFEVPIYSTPEGE